MPITDDVTYNVDVRKKIIVQYYRRRKMFRSDNTMVRPRKLHGDWVQPNEKVTSLFRIGEYRQDYAISIPMEPHSAHNSKKKSTLETTKTMSKVFFQHLENYCTKSTLHGLRYVGDTSLSFGERFFWLAAFLAALAFASYYISKIFEKWDSNPVLVAFHPTDATFNEIPFPSITICNMNQAKRIEAERILKENNSVEKHLLSDYCNYNNITDSHTEAPTWDLVQNFLIKVGQSCSDTVKWCLWQSSNVSCDEFFNNDLTDEGLCCSFNRLPPENIFRNPSDITYLNNTFPKTIFDWSPEVGFPNDSDGDISTIPIRPSGPGTNLGLTVVLDAQLDDYFCSSTSGVGFKIMLSNPIETPKIADYGFLVSPGVEARYVIKPEIRQATPALRFISVEKRQCYFENERPLRYFRSYTKQNCRLECQSNHTLKKCDCIPYYLPKNKKVSVCGKSAEKCTFKAKEDMELVYGNGSSCNCLPSCFEMSFEKSATYSKLIGLNGRFQIENITDEYFRRNMVVLHFYFQESKFRKQIKSEIYGFTEVLSNVGGLLGLCLGFSFLSLVEMAYFVTLKLLCSYVHARKKQQKKKENQRVNSVIPFIR